MMSVQSNEIVTLNEIPSLSRIYVMDAVIAKVHMAIDQAFATTPKTGAETDPADVAQVGQRTVNCFSFILNVVHSFRDNP